MGIPAILLAILAWLIFRVVHYPPFAEFLIATEAEMNKVSWTTKESLYRSTLVVLSTVLLLAVYLFVIDWFWLFLLRMVGVSSSAVVVPSGRLPNVEPDEAFACRLAFAMLVGCALARTVPGR